MPGRSRLLRVMILLGTSIVIGLRAEAVSARSGLLLPYPPEVGRVPAVTFDSAGRRVGDSEFWFEARDDGHFSLHVSMAIRDGARNQVQAEFESVRSGGRELPHLRVLTERSQSFDADGRAMTALFIDHTARVASCTPPKGSSEKATRIALPEDDRVANAPIHLLLLPLVRGEVDRVRFQLFVCRGGARLYDFVALPTGPPRVVGDRSIVEIRYGPDLGRFMSWVASRMLPRLSFWFDTMHDGTYVGHRMPLYYKGPDILMLREGMTPGALGAPF